jgi:hypothetical protein
MPIIQPPPVSKQLQDEIHKAELMHDFITATMPDKFVGDTDQKILVAAIFSLTSEHHGAILHLLKSGRFDGSALALVRPLIDGAYRAHWIYSCAKPDVVVRIKNGENVYDGGKRGQVVKVCADPACRVHHPNTPSPQQVERERAEERRRIEKTKLAITSRHRALAAVLERVSAPLKKADLLTVVHHVIGQLPYNQVPTLAKRHKVEEGKSTKTPQELLAKRVTTYDEAALCRILLEISLLDSAYMRSGASDELLIDAAKRYRVDVEKLEKAVVAEFAAKHRKEAKPKTKPRTKSAT